MGFDFCPFPQGQTERSFHQIHTHFEPKRSRFLRTDRPLARPLTAGPPFAGQLRQKLPVMGEVVIWFMKRQLPLSAHQFWIQVVCMKVQIRVRLVAETMYRESHE